MEHLDNDMDDLFRKAGDLYPLKTTGSDWDGVLGKLRDQNLGDQNTVPVVSAKAERKKRRWLLLLLIIPLGLGSVVYFSSSNKSTAVSSTIAENENNTRAATEATVATVATAAIAATDQTAKIKQGTGTGLSGSQSQEQSLNAAGRAGNDKQDLSTNNVRSGTGNSSGIYSSASVVSAINPDSFHEPVTKPISLSVYSTDKIVSVYGMPLSLASTTTTPLKSPQEVSSKKSKTNTISSSKGLYVGLLGGPDLSAVKFQSVEQLGFSLGVLVGYRFNSRLSLETGVLWDKMYYYSKGEYFKKDQVSIPNNVNILTVNGNCNMFEIPIAVRYDFSSVKNHRFFAKAGLSTYLMNKEYYNYYADSSGGAWPYYRDHTYNTASQNFFSILQISGGYEYAVGKKTFIRIEPYVKIPLQGVGIGSMPISSAGVYFGITHSFR